MIVETSAGAIYPLYLALPEFSRQNSLEAIEARVGDHHLCLACALDDKVVGFKLGYAISGTEFYSWIGGVDPAYRGRGIARRLLERQESWASSEGFQYVSVKSMNRFPAMMQMLLSAGYLIDGFTAGDSDQTHKIHFRKALGG